MALIPRTVHTARERSPSASAARKFATPAAIICHAVAEKGSTSLDFHFLASTEPRAQLNDPPKRLIDAQNWTRPSAVVDDKIRPQQYQQPRHSQPQSDLAAQRDVMITQQQRVQDQKPERGHGNDQSRQSGRHIFFRVRKRQVAAHQQQHTYDRRLEKSRGRVENLSATQRTEREHEYARDEKAYAAHQRWGNLLDRDIDAEIGRSPEEIDQREGHDYCEAVLALGVCRWQLGHWKEIKSIRVRRKGFRFAEFYFPKGLSFRSAVCGARNLLCRRRQKADSSPINLASE